jgi:hypothetical protein
MYILLEIVHFKHSATLAKSFTNTNTNFDFKVISKLIEILIFYMIPKVYPDVGHNLEQNPIVYNDFFYYQRQFFQECLGGRVNKERKVVITDEYD